MPSERKVELELFYNEYDIFKSLFAYYMYASLLMFIVVIINIFNDKKLNTCLDQSLYRVLYFYFLFIIRLAWVSDGIFRGMLHGVMVMNR